MEPENSAQSSENSSQTTVKNTSSQTSATPNSGEQAKSSSKLSFWEIVKFAVITAAIVLPIRTFIAQPFIVSGASMDPTFHDKEYLIVDELSYYLRSPKRGEVAIFRYPKSPSMFFIKRIIGLPGETISIKNNQVTITKSAGQVFILDEPYANGLTLTEAMPTKLGADEYFLIGDNREVSYDSRRWGPVKMKFMKGRALLRLLPPTKLGFLPGNFSQTN